MFFDRALEFIVNHPLLVGSFLALLSLLLALESRRKGPALTPLALSRLVNQADAVVLDVRDAKEFREGHITDARNVPYAQLAERMPDLLALKNRPIVVVCKMGQHSGAVVRQLTQAGFPDVRRLAGGIMTWKADGMPLIKKEGK